MLPYPRRSFAGYRLLQEYFTFPEKFLFFDLARPDGRLAAGLRRPRSRLSFSFRRSSCRTAARCWNSAFRAKTFRLDCAPIVNLFPQTAEPILLDQRNYEYSGGPGCAPAERLEVFSVDEVVSDRRRNATKLVKYEPFYSYPPLPRCASEADVLAWPTAGRPAVATTKARRSIISMVDLSTRPVRPDADTITVRTTCTNRDLPSRLPFGNEEGDFELEGGAAIKRIVALKKPTAPCGRRSGKSSLWRLISHLSLNYLVAGG